MRPTAPHPIVVMGYDGSSIQAAVDVALRCARPNGRVFVLTAAQLHIADRPVTVIPVAAVQGERLAPEGPSAAAASA